ncbi:MAG TPA: hypothetical protein V6C81_31595 [Planktothrix sp.]|jgi:hypothetical protein
MQNKRAPWIILAALVLVVFARTAAVAQGWGQTSSPWATPSINQESPTPWDTPTVEGQAALNGQSYYYAFTAGPGDVTMTLDLSTDVQMASLRLIFRNTAQQQLLNFTNMGTTGGTTISQSFHLANQDRVTVQLMFPLVAGVKMHYRARLSGAISMAGPSANNMQPVPNSSQTPAATMQYPGVPGSTPFTAAPGGGAVYAPMPNSGMLNGGMLNNGMPNSGLPNSDPNAGAGVITIPNSPGGGVNQGLPNGGVGQ